MRNVQNKKISRLLRIISIVSVFAIVLTTLHAAKSQSISGTTYCPSGFQLMLPTATNLMGTVPVNLTIPNSTTMPITAVELRSNDLFIGRMQPSNTYSWALPWITNLFAGPTAKTANLSAYVFSGNSPICNTQPVSVTVLNSTTATLTTTVLPSTWQGPMGSSQLMSAAPKTSTATYDLRPYAKTTWQSSIGNIVSNDPNNAQFSAGFTVGSGSIVARSTYGGASAEVTIPIKVLESTAPLPATTTTSTSNNTTKPATTTTTTSTTTQSGTGTSNTTTTTAPTAIPTQVNTTIQECLVRVLGADRYKAINTKSDRPTATEVEAMNPCFAVSNYIVPANFSPVEPNKQTIGTLPVAKETVIHKLENVSQQKSTASTTGLKISGTSKPNSRVVIYVFSDPLVLTTTADANGNWTYTLDDPIKPGNHEVYSVVDRGDGVYERSAPMSFVIATAEAANTNPQGLSLQLADAQTPKQSDTGLAYYLVAAGALVALVAISFTGFMIIKTRRKKRANKQSEPTQSQLINTEPTDSSAANTPAAPVSSTEVPEPTNFSPTPQSPEEDNPPTEKP